MVLFTKYSTIWLALLPIASLADIIDYNIVLEPDATTVHYSVGYLRAPGFIDLGNTSYVTISDAGVGGNDDDGYVGYRKTRVEIVVFSLPHGCDRKMTCDWAALGVGSRSSDSGILQFCCTEKTAKSGYCSNSPETIGRLIVDDNKFRGDRRSIAVPHKGTMNKTMKYGKMEQTESATYVLLFANCNQMGREILVTGHVVWMSKHGYIPGELFGFVVLFTVMGVMYTALLACYGRAMYLHRMCIKPIEKCICSLVMLGLLNMIVHIVDYLIWNKLGRRSPPFVDAGIVVDALQQGIFRCLMVVLSMGWGAVRESLGTITLGATALLGILFVGATAAKNLQIALIVQNKNTSTSEKLSDTLARLRKLTLVASFVNYAFFVWILFAICCTILVFKARNRMGKLAAITTLWTVSLFVIKVVDFIASNDDTMAAEEKAWTVETAREGIFACALIGIAIVWRPQSSGPEYDSAVEMRVLGADDENDLQLMPVVNAVRVPSDAVYRDDGGSDEPLQIS
jgi:Lung seven transmembrane receptor